VFWQYVILITDRIDEPDRLDLTEIIPERLWIGAAPSKNDLVELKRQHGTELVIMDLLASADEKSLCRELGIMYDERTPKLEETRQAIPLSRLKVVSGVIGDNVDSGKKVILHCLRGTGRSPTCAAAYLIQSGMSVAEAKSTVAGKRQVWSGVAAGYAGLLEEFGKIIEMTRSTF
jgi:dual specificity protein phosphatase-like protein